jgi:hypothetical protein
VRRGGGAKFELVEAGSTLPRLECADRWNRLGWGLDKDKAVLSLCAARICRLVLAEAARDEVEKTFWFAWEGPRTKQIPLHKPPRIGRLHASHRAYETRDRPVPERRGVAASRHLIRHAAEVPVLLSAVASRPDWVLTHNTKHFTQTVERRTGLRIATPVEFFHGLSKSISGYQ